MGYCINYNLVCEIKTGCSKVLRKRNLRTTSQQEIPILAFWQADNFKHLNPQLVINSTPIVEFPKPPGDTVIDILKEHTSN